MGVLLQVAKVARNHWTLVGLYLGFTFAEMDEYKMREPDSHYLRLLRILVDWQNRVDHTTVGALVVACRKAEVGPAAEKALRDKD